jgi:hypothetical protein
MTAEVLTEGELPRCRGEGALTPEPLSHDAWRIKQEARAIRRETRLFHTSVGSVEPVFMVTSSRQDSLFCLPCDVPPDFRHETR